MIDLIPYNKIAILTYIQKPHGLIKIKKNKKFWHLVKIYQVFQLWTPMFKNIFQFAPNRFKTNHEHTWLVPNVGFLKSTRASHDSIWARSYEPCKMAFSHSGFTRQIMHTTWFCHFYDLASLVTMQDKFQIYNASVICIATTP